MVYSHNHMPKFHHKKTLEAKRNLLKSRRKQIGMIVSISLGSLVFIGIIVVVIVYLRRQWARSEENKIRLTARMSGLEECEG